MIQQTNSPLWQELIDESEFNTVPVENTPHKEEIEETGQIYLAIPTPTDIVHVPLGRALDDLSRLMHKQKQIENSIKELQEALKPIAIEHGGIEDNQLAIKVRKGAETVNHEGAVMAHASDSHIDATTLISAIQENSTVAWAKVSKALKVPKSILGRHTEPPKPPTVSFKLKETSDE